MDDKIKDPQPIGDLLAPSKNRLGWIITRANKINALNSLVNEILPPTLAGRATVTNMEDTTLILQAQNGTIATQLRYQSRNLLNSLHFYREWHYFKDIRVIVRT